MNLETLKTLSLVGAALTLGACGTLADIVNQSPAASSAPQIVAAPEPTGKPNPRGPLKRETAELRAQLNDPKAFYKYQYEELWVVGAFPIH